METRYVLLNGTALPGLHRDTVRDCAGEFLLRMGWTHYSQGDLEVIHDNFALALNAFQAAEARRLKQERIARDMAQFYREQEATYFPPMEEKS